MTTLEDKILGEKKQYYCSSSESEDEGEESEQSEEETTSRVIKELEDPRAWGGTSSNTGPKGVIRDWQRFKQLETEKKEEKQREKLELIKKLSLTCNPPEDDGNQDKEFDGLLNDDFLIQYQKERMMEMLSTNSLPTFGKLVDLRNGNEFLEAVDNEHKSVTIIIHIYETNVSACKSMNKSLDILCRDYPHVKFCKLVGSSAGMSHRFKVEGVPALLVYKGGQVVGNFVRVTDELGEEFYEYDVENFLIEHGMIVDRSCVPTLLSSKYQAQDSDSDISLE